MKRVKVQCYVGNGRDVFEDELEFPNDMSEDEIEEEVRDFVMQQLEWDWSIIDEEDDGEY